MRNILKSESFSRIGLCSYILIKCQFSLHQGIDYSAIFNQYQSIKLKYNIISILKSKTSYQLKKKVYTGQVKAKVQKKNFGFNMKSVALGKSLRGQETPEKKNYQVQGTDNVELLNQPIFTLQYQLAVSYAFGFILKI